MGLVKLYNLYNYYFPPEQKGHWQGFLTSWDVDYLGLKIGYCTSSVWGTIMVFNNNFELFLLSSIFI